jgi:hypothetical protein
VEMHLNFFLRQFLELTSGSTSCRSLSKFCHASGKTSGTSNRAQKFGVGWADNLFHIKPGVDLYSPWLHLVEALYFGVYENPRQPLFISSPSPGHWPSPSSFSFLFVLCGTEYRDFDAASRGRFFVVMRDIPIQVLAHFPLPNYKNPHTRGLALLYINGILIGITVGLVFLRIYTRVYIKRWMGADDWFIIIATVSHQMH